MTRLMVVVLLFAASAHGAGFRIDTQAGRATGMGGAVSALVEDSSSNYYNPAGLTAQGKGFEVMAGDTLIIPQLKFTGPDGTTTSSVFSVSPPPHAYVRAGLMEELAVGVGFFTGYGASGNWPDGWVGQFKALRSSLQTFNLNVNLAYAPHRRISFGAGVNVVRGTLTIERALDFVDSVGAVQLGGGAWGVGFNGGIRVEVIENLMWFGGAVRGNTDLNFSGAAHFTGVPQEFQSRIYDQAIRGKVQLPLTGQFGLGFKIFDKLKLGLDVTYVNWQSFKELRIEFVENDDLTVPLAKRWFDTASFHIGVEYDVTRSLQARLGFVYDPTPTPSTTLTPDLPDATRIKVAAGVGYQHSSGFFADLGFQFVVLLSQPATSPCVTAAADQCAGGLPGTYSGTAQVLSLSLGFRKTAAPKLNAEEAPPAPEEKKEEPAPAKEEKPAEGQPQQ
ncbi:MAG: outer membrane protein transport protein [Myxococcaceae bacterium]|nr:outer membrane protein transport protein [Myxococcaceae bacterium]